uniref:Uncharacterized protein n=1 Tax=Parascaris equorum TaxID=6256 RepID=A0A914RSR8_PAREQ
MCMRYNIEGSQASESTSGCEASANGDHITDDMLKDVDESPKEECNDETAVVVEEAPVKFETSSSVQDVSEPKVKVGLCKAVIKGT